MTSIRRASPRSISFVCVTDGSRRCFDSFTHFISSSRVPSWPKYHHMQATHTQRAHLPQHTALFWMFERRKVEEEEESKMEVTEKEDEKKVKREEERQARRGHIPQLTAREKCMSAAEAASPL
ncbi:hypothetical protein DPX16_20471 [Anabarilius grahami]|uniref:Uncharacterized protein n=1 Tax=Anabarilius grahami TaxID=495550 RepID=A0A3N0Z4W3_ANAGA|nr:hypothetical protein DPX16_20471 [Anabarilius grahami]